MTFRRPEQNKSSPSLGYRLSSNRQPGIEQANNRMPQYANPIDRGPSNPINRSPRPFPMPEPEISIEFGEPFRPPPGRRPTMSPRPERGLPLQKPESFTNLDMLGRPDLAFKYSHMEPGRTGKDFFGFEQDESIRGDFRRTEDARPSNRLYDEYGYLEGAPRQRTTFSEGSMDPHRFNAMYDNDASMTRNRGYDDAIFRTVDPNTNQIEQFPMAQGIEQAAVDPSDWRTIEKILLTGGDPGTETALNIGDTFPLEGLGRQRPYGETRDMGPLYEELKTIPLDLQFDQWGYPIGQDDWGYIGAARGGLMSLRR